MIEISEQVAAALDGMKPGQIAAAWRTLRMLQAGEPVLTTRALAADVGISRRSAYETLVILRSVGLPIPTAPRKDRRARCVPSGVCIWTYVIQQGGENGHVKIGKTRDVDKRLAALQTANPLPLRVIGKMPGDHERRLHHHLRMQRRSGEWFEWNDYTKAEVDAFLGAPWSI